MMKLNKGYSGVSCAAMIIISLILIAAINIAAVLLKCDIMNLSPLMIAAIIGSGALSLHLPCRILSDDAGFTVYVLFKGYRFEYAEIMSIRNESIPLNKGFRHTLFIVTRDRGEKRFIEISRTKELSGLMVLCDHVNFAQTRLGLNSAGQDNAPVNSGIYVGFNTAATMMIVGAMFGGSSVIGVISVFAKTFVPEFVFFAIGAALLLSAGNGYKCSWSADESGFTVKQLFSTKRIRYSDIQRMDINVNKVDVKDLMTTYGHYTKADLVVIDRSGRVTRFSEQSGLDYFKLINEPVNRNKPQLVLLYDSVTARGQRLNGYLS